MTWTVVILLAIAYVLIGAFVGYFMFCEDEMGMLLGIVAWPFFIIALMAHLVLHVLYKFVDFTVKFIKRLCRGEKRKTKDSLGHGTDDERFTKCDKCPWFKDCYDLGRLLEITEASDSKRHYILQLGETCDRGYVFDELKEE